MQEKSQLIATKIMGWKLINLSIEPDVKYMVWAVVGPDGRLTSRAGIDWNPFKFFVHAWEIVDKMIAGDWEFSLEYANQNEVPGEPLEYEWWCSFLYFTDDPEDHKMASAKGDTPAEAISNAALEVIEKYEQTQEGRG